MYFIAYKSLFRRKLRTFLAAIGVSIGVLLLVVILSVMLGMSSMMDELTLAMVGDIGVLQEGEMDLMSELDKDIEDTINRVPGVIGTAPKVFVFVKAEGLDLVPLGGLIDEDMLENLPEEFTEEMGGVRLVGINPEKELFFDSYPTKIIKGTLFSAGDSDVCVIGSMIVDQSDLDVGDRISVTYDIDGDGIEPSEKHSFKIVGIYESGSEMKDDNIVVNIEDAQNVKGLRSSVVSKIDVRAEPQVEEDVIRKLKVMIPEVDVGNERTMLSMMTRITSNITLMTVLMIGFSGLISLFFILIIMITSVMERTKEIGVLRATGWYKSDVLKLILVESLLLAIFGTIIGTALGISSLLAIHQIFPGIQVIITPPLVGAVIIFGLVVGSVAGVYPAYRAASLSPLEAFRGAE
ncbi:MAG: FtsX-like permease family protein [Halobacteriota archaeon]|nr:FtsX-like permease family protein [Halobacteriota archaeon]